jgi:hypothetical protein
MDFFYFLAQSDSCQPNWCRLPHSPLWCHLSSDQCHHAAASCHDSFTLSQDELVASTSSSSNASSHHLPSRVETKVLNPHHRRRLHSLDRPTSILYCYKKILNIGHSLHHSTTSPFCLLPSQSIIPSEHHPRHRSLSP